MEEERPESDVVIQDAIMQDVENCFNNFSSPMYLQLLMLSIVNPKGTSYRKSLCDTGLRTQARVISQSIEREDVI